MYKKYRFYVFDEHTDYIKECKKKGFIPTKQSGYFIEEFEYNGDKYKVLGRNECYSGWEINIVPSKTINFDELLFIALNSHIYDEIVVSIGLILKNYYNDFITVLKTNFLAHKLKHNEKKLVNLIIKDICSSSYDVSNMKELRSVCNEALG